MGFLNGRGYAEDIYGETIHFLINLFSFTGFILTIIFSLILIFSNINFKDK